MKQFSFPIKESLEYDVSDCLPYSLIHVSRPDMMYVEGHPKVPRSIDSLNWLTIRVLLAVPLEHVSQSWRRAPRCSLSRSWWCLSPVASARSCWLNVCRLVTSSRLAVRGCDCSSRAGWRGRETRPPWAPLSRTQRRVGVAERKNVWNVGMRVTRCFAARRVRNLGWLACQGDGQFIRCRRP
jgi:hypothetical protein